MENTINLLIVAVKPKKFTDTQGVEKDYISCVVDLGDDLATIGTGKKAKAGDFLAVGLTLKDGKLLPKVLDVIADKK